MSLSNSTHATRKTPCFSNQSHFGCKKEGASKGLASLSRTLMSSASSRNPSSFTTLCPPPCFFRYVCPRTPFTFSVTCTQSTNFQEITTRKHYCQIQQHSVRLCAAFNVQQTSRGGSYDSDSTFRHYTQLLSTTSEATVLKRWSTVQYCTVLQCIRSTNLGAQEMDVDVRLSVARTLKNWECHSRCETGFQQTLNPQKIGVGFSAALRGAGHQSQLQTPICEQRFPHLLAEETDYSTTQVE